MKDTVAVSQVLVCSLSANSCCATDPEEHAASIYHMIHEGDHVISVNDNDVQYAFDVSASMKKAQVCPPSDRSCGLVLAVSSLLCFL